MPSQRNPRDPTRYHLKEGNKIIHTGITIDPERREAEHQRARPKSHLETQGPKVTNETALRWEQQQRGDGKPTEGYK